MRRSGRAFHCLKCDVLTGRVLPHGDEGRTKAGPYAKELKIRGKTLPLHKEEVTRKQSNYSGGQSQGFMEWFHCVSEVERTAWKLKTYA